jgi:hypothetical protein
MCYAKIEIENEKERKKVNYGTPAKQKEKKLMIRGNVSTCEDREKKEQR